MLHLRILNKVFQVNPLNATSGSGVINRQMVTAAPTAVVPGEEDSGDDVTSKTAEEDVAPTVDGIDVDKEIEIISNLQEMDLFRHLECIIKEVHLLWELVLTNEPIIVIGNSPSISSQVVQSLVR